MKRFLIFITLLLMPICIGCLGEDNDRVAIARNNVCAALGEHFGKPVFIRIIKEEYLLELWLQEKDGTWNCFRSYEIAGMSGEIGPKTMEGDRQAPEGFYRVKPQAMNPHSSYHLSFNIGYPNAYDRSLGRTGSYIMVHGSDVSVGCFAMTDEKIEEIYSLVNEAFLAGAEDVPVQVYPFRMTPQRMQAEAQSEHYAFWQHLLPGWQHTETRREPYPDTDGEVTN